MKLLFNCLICKWFTVFLTSLILTKALNKKYSINCNIMKYYYHFKNIYCNTFMYSYV